MGWPLSLRPQPLLELCRHGVCWLVAGGGLSIPLPPKQTSNSTPRFPAPLLIAASPQLTLIMPPCLHPCTTHRAPSRSGCLQDLSERRPRGPLRRHCPPPRGRNEVRRRSAGGGVVCLCCAFAGAVATVSCTWYNTPCSRRRCVGGLFVACVCIFVCAMCGDMSPSHHDRGAVAS